MHYVDEGSGHPVVMVHGNPTWSFYWRALIADLREDHRAIAADHVGMGLSDKPPAGRYPHTLERRIADFGSFIAGLELTEPITLIVHDWGGAIGLGWAVDHPDLVRRIVVTNTAAFHLPQGRSMPAALRLARSRPLGTASVLLANAFVRGAIRWGVAEPLDPAVRAGYLAAHSSVADRLAVLRFVLDIPLRPADPSYSTVTAVSDGLDRLAHVPMLICWGARDFVFDDHFLAEWQARFPGARVHRFADAGHLVMEDAADQIISLVRAFLR